MSRTTSRNDRHMAGVTIHNVQAAIRADRARERKEEVRKAEESARRERDEREQREDDYWTGLYSISLAVDRDKEAGKLKKAQLDITRVITDEQNVPPATRLWRLENTPQKFRKILWATEHIVRNVEVRKQWRVIAKWLKLDQSEYSGFTEEEKKTSQDELFYRIIDRWEKTADSPRLKQLIVILYGLGIEDAAKTLQEPKFKHLLDTEKRKVPKAGTPRTEEKVREETEENFWKSIYKLSTASERDLEVGAWWPYEERERKNYVKEYESGEYPLGKFTYETKLCPIPVQKLGPASHVKIWKRSRADPSGIVPASRLQRLDMTPKRQRNMLWAAEHIVGNTEVRRKWQQIATAMGLEFADFKKLTTQQISLDEKFYQVVDLKMKKGRFYLGDLIKALKKNGVEDASTYLQKPRFFHLLDPQKTFSTI